MHQNGIPPLAPSPGWSSEPGRWTSLRRREIIMWKLLLQEYHRHHTCKWKDLFDDDPRVKILSNPIIFFLLFILLLFSFFDCCYSIPSIRLSFTFPFPFSLFHSIGSFSLILPSSSFFVSLLPCIPIFFFCLGLNSWPGRRPSL